MHVRLRDPFFRMFVRQETCLTIADAYTGNEDDLAEASLYFKHDQISTVSSKRASNWSDELPANLPKCPEGDVSYPWKKAENLWLFEKYLHGRISKRDMNDALFFRYRADPNDYPHNADLLLKWADVVFDEEDLSVCLEQFDTAFNAKGCYRSFVEQSKLIARTPVLMLSARPPTYFYTRVSSTHLFLGPNCARRRRLWIIYAHLTPWREPSGRMIGQNGCNPLAMNLNR